MSIKNIYLYTILISAFACGYFIESNLAKTNIIIISQVFMALMAIAYLLLIGFRFGMSRIWFTYGGILFILLLINNSRHGSILLLFVNLVFFEIIRALSLQHKLVEWLRDKKVSLIIYFCLLISVISLLVYGQDSSLWTADSKAIFLPRFNFTTWEPSQLGYLVAPLIFIASSIRSRIALFIVLIISQSYLGYLFFVFLCLYFSAYRKFLWIIITITSFLVLPGLEFADYFENSGLVRLVGATLFIGNDLDVVKLLFGGGLGSGNEKLTFYFNEIGVDIANGFIFSTIYDLGLLGVFLLVRLIAKTKDEVLLILFIWLNISVGSVLFLASLFFCKTAEISCMQRRLRRG